MITANTTLGQLMDVAKLLEPEHGPLQGVVLHRNGLGRVHFTWRAFELNLNALPQPPAAPAPGTPAAPQAKEGK